MMAGTIAVLTRCGASGAFAQNAASDGYTDASTQAAIGKASLIIEEQQNWAEE